MKQQLGWTTLEQSKKLIEAGLDPNTADMYYYKDQLCLIYGDSNYNNIFELFDSDGVSSNLTPCWSLGKLIELMPNDTYIYKSTQGKYYIHTTIELFGTKNDYKEIIDAAVEIIIWLLENNYIKKGETK